MDLVDKDVKWDLFIARVLKAEILMNKSNVEGSRSEIGKAIEIIPEDIDLWRLGVGVRRNYYERGLKIKNDVK
jgi:hypothetical protein